MAYMGIEAAQARWPAVNAPRVTFVRPSVLFEPCKLIERGDQDQETAA